jgi:hypothetical protein
MPIDQDVFGFDVSMNDIQLVQVQKCLRDDDQEMFSLMLRKAVLWLGQQVVVERVGSSVLQYQVEFALSFDDVD